jgi:hypothetical protein
MLSAAVHRRFSQPSNASTTAELEDVAIPSKQKRAESFRHRRGAPVPQVSCEDSEALSADCAASPSILSVRWTESCGNRDSDRGAFLQPTGGSKPPRRYSRCDSQCGTSRRLDSYVRIPLLQLPSTLANAR